MRSFRQLADSFYFAFKHSSRLWVLGFHYFLELMYFPFCFYLCSFFTIYYHFIVQPKAFTFFQSIVVYHPIS